MKIFANYLIDRVNVFSSVYHPLPMFLYFLMKIDTNKSKFGFPLTSEAGGYFVVNKISFTFILSFQIEKCENICVNGIWTDLVLYQCCKINF